MIDFLTRRTPSKLFILCVDSFPFVVDQSHLAQSLSHRYPHLSRTIPRCPGALVCTLIRPVLPATPPVAAGGGARVSDAGWGSYQHTDHRRGRRRRTCPPRS